MAADTVNCRYNSVSKLISYFLTDEETMTLLQRTGFMQIGLGPGLLGSGVCLF